MFYEMLCHHQTFNQEYTSEKEIYILAVNTEREKCIQGPTKPFTELDTDDQQKPTIPHPNTAPH
jgi:hypothetical protein